MKLKITSVYSQRDSHWGSILLGYNTNPQYTISSYGCLITCYAMYLSSIGKAETPQTVNQKLKALGENVGFEKGSGNLIWGSLSIIWGITNDYISPSYSGPVTDFGVNKMKALLDEGKPLICHVDFDPQDIDDDQHWVLVYGYEPDTETFYICDSWTGRSDLTLDVYGGTRRAVISFRTYTQTVAKQDVEVTPSDQALQECQTQLGDEIKKKNENWQWGKDLEVELEGTKAEIISHENFMKQLSITLRCDNDTAKILGEVSKFVTIQDQLRQAQKNVEDSKVNEVTLVVEKTELQKKVDLCLKEKSELFIANGKSQKVLQECQSQLSTQLFTPIVRFMKTKYWLCKEV